MPTEAYNRPSDLPSTFELAQAAQTIPAERLNPTAEVVDEQFSNFVAAQREFEASQAAATATTEAQEIAQASADYNVPGRMSTETANDRFDAIVGTPEMQGLDAQADVQAQVDGYRIPTGTEAETAEAVLPASAETRQYAGEQAKMEALNAGDAVMRVRRESLRLAA